MKKLIIILCALCFTVSVANADGVIKRRIIGEAAPSCATQSTDVEYTTYNTSSAFDVNDERGQSFTTVGGGVLYSISIHRTDMTGGTVDVTFRVDNGSSMEVYLTEFTCGITAATNAFVECVIPEANRINLSATTTYYFLIQNTENVIWNINRDSANGYAGGTAFYDATENWQGTASAGSDLPFRIKVCD